MTINTGERIYRAATLEEKARHRQIREEIQDELPELQQRGRQKLRDLMQSQVDIHHAIALLKAERIKQGLTLSQLNESTGIDAAMLKQLEDNEDANPTISVLTRYADAMGKKVFIVLANAD